VELGSTIFRVGGFATRQLYSDQDEQLFDAMRPVVLNAIEDIVARPDLADRSVFLTLQNIPDDKRKAEADFWRDFERDHPRILGALLDGVARGLRQLPNTRLDRKPRMADFAMWATACETAFWKAGTFAQAYGQNREEAVTTVIEADLVATAVQKFIAERPDLEEQPTLVAQRGVWCGASSNLLGALKMAVGEDQAKQKEWPQNPRALPGYLRRAAATLRKVGIEITFDRTSGGSSGGKRTRTITIASLGRGDDRPHRPDRPQTQDINDIGGDGGGDDSGGDGVTVPPTVPTNSLKSKPRDGGDDRDVNLPTQTGKMSTRTAKPKCDEPPPLETCANCGRADGAVYQMADMTGASRFDPNGQPEDAPSVYLHEACAQPFFAAARSNGQAGQSNGQGEGTTASVQFMITQEVKRRLRICGYSDEQIANMTPQQAHDILARQGWQAG